MGGKVLSGLHFAALRIGKRRAWVGSENTYAAAGRFSPRGPLGTSRLLLSGNEFNGSLDTRNIAFDLSDTLFGYIV